MYVSYLRMYSFVSISLCCITTQFLCLFMSMFTEVHFVVAWHVSSQHQFPFCPASYTICMLHPPGLSVTFWFDFFIVSMAFLSWRTGDSKVEVLPHETDTLLCLFVIETGYSILNIKKRLESNSRE